RAPGWSRGAVRPSRRRRACASSSYGAPQLALGHVQNGAVDLLDLGRRALDREEPADERLTRARTPPCLGRVRERLADGVREMLGGAGRHEPSRLAVDHHVRQTSDARGDGRARRTERLDGAAAVLRHGRMDRDVERRVDGWDVAPMAGETDRPATAPPGVGAQSSLVRLGARPRAADDRGTHARTPEPLDGVDEVLVALHAASLAEEPPRGVDVRDHAGERNVGADAELAPNALALVGTLVEGRAVVRQEHPLARDAQAEVRLLGPATRADPVIARPRRGELERAGDRMLQMQRARHLEDAGHGMYPPEREPGDERRADEVAVEQVRLHALDERAAPAERERQARAPHEVDVGLDHARPRTGVLRREAVLARRQRHDHVDAEGAERGDLAKGPGGATRRLHEVQDRHATRALAVVPLSRARSHTAVTE